MTLSKERLEQYIRQPLENSLTRGEVMQLAKMMINQDDWNAAQQKVIDELRVQLERRERDKQEPVRYMNRFTGACYTLAQQPDAATDTAVYVPLYAEPPAPALPESLLSAMEEVLRISDRQHDAWDKAKAAVSAFRTAALNQTHVNQASSNGQSFGNSEQLNSPVTPDGWVMVPAEPTWSMLSADGCSKHHGGQECSHHENRKRIWRAMLAAAPKQESE